MSFQMGMQSSWSLIAVIAILGSDMTRTMASG